MKKFSHLVTLLPCQSLEDFPVGGTKTDAQSLLAAWTGTWHPSLIAAAGKAPAWRRANDTVSSDAEAEQHRDSFIQQHYYDDDGTANYDGQSEFDFDADVFESFWRDSLIVIPAPANKTVFDGFETAALGLNATVAKDFTTRTELISILNIHSEIESYLVDDFFSLGYIRLQIEMMNRKLRYSSELDCDRFNEIVVAAANAAADGDPEPAKQKLQSAFDLLAEEKNRYYPVAADLVDMLLLTEAIRTESIDEELKTDSPLSFVMTGGAARGIEQRSPATVKAIRERIEDGNDCLVGGPENELPDNLLSIETILNQLKVGRSSYENVFGCSTDVFMRRRYGLNASLPGILKSFKFAGALHVSLDRGIIPTPSSNSVRWMGIDGGAIMAISETPLDASSDKSFLDLGVRIGSELDSAHVATIFFARWPTQTCDSFQDLKNAGKYGKVLGDFTNADSYFENVYDPGYGDSFEAEEYESPWLSQAIESGSVRPISTFIDYWETWYKLSAIESLIAMMAIGSNKNDLSDAVQQLAQIRNRLELQTRDWTSPWDDSVAADSETLCSKLVAIVGGSLINTVPWRRRVHLISQAKGGPGAVQGDGAVKHAARGSERCNAIVELSGFGQLFVNPSGLIESSKLITEPLIDDKESILRNELFEVRMDRESGGIRGVYFYGKRGNLFSQKLAVRYVDPTTKKVHYSKMICESFEVITVSRIASEIRTSGNLLDTGGTVLASFNQTVSLQRGRRVIGIDIEITEKKRLNGSTENYIANRIAWAEESGELFCDIHGARQAIRRPTIEAPHYVEVVQGENRFALLTHGLPWHRRASKKVLDSILIAGNETRTNFRLGVAINPESTMQAAVSEMHPVLQDIRVDDSDCADAKESDWLFHIANRNIIATSCEPVFDDDCRCTGMRVRLQEVDGNDGTLKLYCKRSLESADKESFDNEFSREIVVNEESPHSERPVLVEVDFAAFEYFQIHLHWSNK
jgi:alpha-mannosidase